MNGSKLFEVIRTFEEEELNQLHTFLRSPYFAQSRHSEVVLRLFELILEGAPTFQTPKLSKEKAFAHLFPNKAYHKGQLEKTMSLLLKEIFRFITYHKSKLEENEILTLLAQAKFFREKQMDKFFNKTIDHLKKEQAQTVRRSKDFYYHQYLIEKEISEYQSLFNTRKEELNLPNTLNSLDVFYLLSKLEYTCWLLAQNQNLTSSNLEENIAQLEEFLPQIPSKTLKETPLIQAYIYAFSLLQGKNEEASFLQLKELLEAQEESIPLEQLKALGALNRNYWIIKYNNGEVKNLAEAFRLYRTHLEKGYLYYEGGVLPSTIRNLVSMGLKLKEYEWVYQFLDASRNKISGTKHPEDVFQFNLACYYFALREYEKALELLSDKYEDLYYRIVAKRLEIMIYYEQDSPITNSRLDAFKIFIFRMSKTTLSDLQREGNNNFADMLKQIMNPKTMGNPVRVNKLIQKIKEKKVVVDKAWLLETMQRLSSRSSNSKK